MKQTTLILLGVLLFLASCQKEQSLPQTPLIEADPLASYNLTKRPFNEELARRTKGRKPTTAISTGNVLFLDFDGHTVTNTSWNANDVINAKYSGLDLVEQDTVISRTTRALAPYKITVTTDSTVFHQASALTKMRLILTETWEWYGKVGGVAYIGSFTWGDATPCFVFTSLYNYNAKIISDAAIHEAGHTFGLSHQAVVVNGTVTNNYNPGDGTSAPWMGVPYSVPFGSWWKGYNSNGQWQDDHLILSKLLGIK